MRRRRRRNLCKVVAKWYILKPPMDETNNLSNQEKNIFDEAVHLQNTRPREQRSGYKDVVRDVYKKSVETLIRHAKITSRFKTQAEGKEEGMKELVKEETKGEETKKNKLQELTSKNHVVLMKAKTFFPFDFFPDTLIIDMTKVNIIAKRFWATEHIININLKDVVDVSVETALFMGNLIITYVPSVEGMMGMIEPTIHRMALMKRKDALRAQRILKGILVARREGIEISKCTPEELMHVIERFGEYSGATEATSG